MKQLKLYVGSLLALLLFVMMEANFVSASSYQTWEEKTDVNPHHVWTIKFNGELNPKTVNADHIYVLHNGEAVKDVNVSLGQDFKSIKIKAPFGGYQEHGQYVLYIENDVKSLKGQALKKSVKMNFTVGEKSLASKLLVPVKGWETQEELSDLLALSPYHVKTADYPFVRHQVSDELAQEIYDKFGVETNFSYGFYTGLLSDIGYKFTASEEMFHQLKEEIIEILGEPYVNNDNEFSVEWRKVDKNQLYDYGRVVLYIYDGTLRLSQITL